MEAFWPEAPTASVGRARGLGKFLRGEGGFLLRVSGHGTLLGSCYGALIRRRLAPGERIVVDAGRQL